MERKWLPTKTECSHAPPVDVTQEKCSAGLRAAFMLHAVVCGSAFHFREHTESIRIILSYCTWLARRWWCCHACPWWWPHGKTWNSEPHEKGMTMATWRWRKMMKDVLLSGFHCLHCPPLLPVSRCKRLSQACGSKFRAHGVWVRQLRWKAGRWHNIEISGMAMLRCTYFAP